MTRTASWTPELDQVLRDKWGVVPTRGLAEELGRSMLAIKQRARKIGLRNRRRFTPDEVQLVKDLYPTHTAAQIAKRLYGTGRSAKAIFTLAKRLGLRKWPSHAPEVIDRVRELHAEGLNDYEIAARMPGFTRDQVHSIRYERLKLPMNEASIAEARRRAVKTQYTRLGVANGGELRALAYRNFAVNNGWPDDLPPRAVQILNILAEQGPKTSPELAAAIGTKTDARNSVTGYRQHLKCSSHSPLVRGHGTYTGLLQSRGLIVRQNRSLGPGCGTRGGRIPGLYMLTPAAVAIREECLERIKRNGGDAASDETQLHHAETV